VSVGDQEAWLPQMLCMVDRRGMFLVKSGAPVDATIDSLIPLLEKGDIMIDGGNEWYVSALFLHILL